MSDEIPLSEIADVLGGFAFKSEHFTADGFPVVKIANIEPPHVNLSDCDRIPKDKVRGLDRFALNDRDIVMAMTGATIGKVGRVRSVTPAYLNQRVAKIAAKAGREFDDFVWAIVSQRGFDEEVLNNAGGSAQANVSTDGIGRIRIPSFSPDERRAIGKVISALDDKIELNRRMNRTLEELAAALFRSWFVDFDPVVAKAAGRPPAHLRPDLAALFPAQFQPSALGDIPQGWRAENLGDVIELAYGKASKESDRISGSVPVYGSNGQVGLHNQKLVEGPGIVVGRKGNPGIVTWAAEDFFPIDTTFYVVRKDREIGWQFLFHALCALELEGLAADSAVPGLNRTAALQNNILIPPQEIRDAFERIVTPWWHQVLHNERESRTLAALRDTLLPKLLSGELRVKPAEKILEAGT